MEFDAIVFGQPYTFSPLTKDSYLISGSQAEYILYKRDIWRCADEITLELLQKLGAAIEARMQPAHH